MQPLSQHIFQQRKRFAARTVARVKHRTGRAEYVPDCADAFLRLAFAKRRAVQMESADHHVRHAPEKLFRAAQDVYDSAVRTARNQRRFIPVAKDHVLLVHKVVRHDRAVFFHQDRIVAAGEQHALRHAGKQRHAVCRILVLAREYNSAAVCTTEFMTFATMADEFKALNTELIGLSVDSLYAHIAWLRKIQELEWNGMKHVEVKFPLIEDIRMDVANKFGMIQPGQSNTQAVRAVFVIDPNAKIRTILYYPLSTGRNFDEIKRIILALQKADKDSVATPANWRPGDDVIVPTAGSCGTAKERMESQNDGQYCLDWFMCFRKEKK